MSYDFLKILNLDKKSMFKVSICNAKISIDEVKIVVLKIVSVTLKYFSISE